MAIERHHSVSIAASLVTVASFVGATAYTQPRSCGELLPQCRDREHRCRLVRDRRGKGELTGAAIGLALAVCSAAQLMAARHDVDPAASTMTVHVKKAGLFRTFGDDHEIRAPLKSGFIDDGLPSAVDITIDASRLQVLDPSASKSDRDQVQARMLGPDVLDVSHFPQIRFQSTTVVRTAAGWNVTGQLTLHGETHPIVVAVTNDRGRYRGTASFNQTAFGMKPVSVAGGAVKVRDEVSIDFDIVTRSTQ